MSKVEQELQDITGINPDKGEKRQDYLLRLLDAVDAMDDTAHDKLSKAAKQWSKEGTEAFNAKSPLPDFNEEAPVTGKSSKATKTKSAAEKPAKKAAKPAAKKAISKDNGKEKAAKDDRQARPRGSLPAGRNKYVQDILADNPRATIEEIIAVLEKKGVPIPTRFSISTSRSSFRSALETMKRKGMLKSNIEL